MKDRAPAPYAAGACEWQLPINPANEFDGLFLPAGRRRDVYTNRKIRAIDRDRSRNCELAESHQKPIEIKGKTF